MKIHITEQEKRILEEDQWREAVINDFKMTNKRVSSAYDFILALFFLSLTINGFTLVLIFKLTAIK